MSRTIGFGLLFASFVVATMPVASASLSKTALPRQPIVLKISDLRSAYLLRAGVVRYDNKAMSSDGVREQLQRHFDVVLGILLIATPQSIETTLNRLQASSDANWSAEERGQLRRQLLASRYLQISRLAAYRDRGLFPQNEGQAIGPVPIFVDRHDTACAVGHLMRVSGWQAVVAQVERMNNLIYVPDAAASAVARWVLTSGLTLEEAALIQPGYPISVNEFMSQYGPGGQALIKDGLRYENFQLTADNFINPPTNIDPSVCRSNPDSCLGSPIPGGVLPNVESIGIRAEKGTYLEPITGAYIDPVGTHWLAIGGVRQASGPQFINGRAPAGFAQRIKIQFDVAPVSSNMKIDQLTQHDDALEGGFQHFPFFPMDQTPDFNYVMLTRILSGINQIATTELDRDTPAQFEPSFSGGQKVSTVNFQPQSQLTVETGLYLISGAAVDAIALDFNVILVPEPGTLSIGFMLVAGLILGGAGRRRRRS